MAKLSYAHRRSGPWWTTSARRRPRQDLPEGSLLARGDPVHEALEELPVESDVPVPRDGRVVLALAQVVVADREDDEVQRVVPDQLQEHEVLGEEAPVPGQVVHPGGRALGAQRGLHARGDGVTGGDERAGGPAVAEDRHAELVRRRSHRGRRADLVIFEGRAEAVLAERARVGIEPPPVLHEGAVLRGERAPYEERHRAIQDEEAEHERRDEDQRAPRGPPERSRHRGGLRGARLRGRFASEGAHDRGDAHLRGGARGDRHAEPALEIDEDADQLD